MYDDTRKIADIHNRYVLPTFTERTSYGFISLIPYEVRSTKDGRTYRA